MIDPDELYDDTNAANQRRETFMQRRMRHVRGEATDDTSPDDEAPEAPDPRSRRYVEDDEPIYVPTQSGGGCAQAMLYAILGAMAMALIAVFAGNQMISNLTGGMQRQIDQALATPTTTVRDRGGAIQQIRSLNRLETQVFSIERIVEASQSRGDWLDVFMGDKLLLVASGEVIAGVDMSKLRSEDITISADGKSITLRLPPSEILSSSLNSERTRVYDRQSGLFVGANQNIDLESQARQRAEVEILAAACENNILQKAADEAERSLENLLKLMDFEQVTVVATPGTCPSQ